MTIKFRFNVFGKYNKWYSSNTRTFMQKITIIINLILLEMMPGAIAAILTIHAKA